MSRGEIAMRLLLEMNHEVRGDCVQESIEQVGFLGKVDILQGGNFKSAAFYKLKKCMK